MSTYVAKPYIGITGITTPWEIETITGKWFEIFKWQSYLSGDFRRFMNGVLVSSKSLAGRQPSNPNQYPRVKDARALMPDDSRVMNTVHFNISGVAQRPSRVGLLGSYLDRIVKRLPETEAIQINLAWPQVGLLRAFKQHHPQLIILQVGTATYELLGNEPAELVTMLRAYQGVADYVLIDPSGGTGKQFNLNRAQMTLEALVNSGLDMEWGVAGGLGPDSLGRLKKLLEIYPNLSWDSQGRLRDENDNLQWASCFEFLRGSLELARASWDIFERAGSS